MESVRTVVHADFHQYYIYGGTDFDESSVDDLMDGLLGPRGSGARVLTRVQWGPIGLTVHVTDEPLQLPTDVETVAAACNLDVSSGALAINSWAGAAVFRHDFGRPLTCAVLIKLVPDGDWADAVIAAEADLPREWHDITLSTVPLVPARWRSVSLARAREPKHWPDVPGPIQPPPPPPIDPVRQQQEAQQRRAALETMASRAQWGDVEPSQRLQAVGGAAAAVAKVDQPIAEAIASSDPTTQRAIARWAARAACSIVEGDPEAWAAAALDALDNDLALPPPFDDWATAWRSFFPGSTTVVGLKRDEGDLPGRVTTIAPKAAAIAALFAATEPDAARAALNAVWQAAAARSDKAAFLADVAGHFSLLDHG